MRDMRYLVTAICAAMLWSGAAAALEMTPGTNTAPSFLIFPTWYEVVDIIKQGRTNDKDPDAAPAPKQAEGELRPYIGIADISPTAYLVPGNLLDVSGGLSYYVPRTGKAGSVGMIFAVKDRVSNRLRGYAFEPSNLTTYVSFSINY